VVEGAPFAVVVQAQRSDGSVDPGFAGTVTLAVAAAAGVATFDELRLAPAGDYTLRASADGLADALSGRITAGAPAPVVVAVGTFAGQNGYTTSGSFVIERGLDGGETFRTSSDFRTSSGLGSVSIWLTDAQGARSLRSTSHKLLLGTPVQDGARINFGNALLRRGESG
jgi:hypothetical protein